MVGKSFPLTLTSGSVQSSAPSSAPRPLLALTRPHPILLSCLFLCSSLFSPHSFCFSSQFTILILHFCFQKIPQLFLPHLIKPPSHVSLAPFHFPRLGRCIPTVQGHFTAHKSIFQTPPHSAAPTLTPGTMGVNAQQPRK